jgi:adenylate cyclase
MVAYRRTNAPFNLYEGKKLTDSIITQTQTDLSTLRDLIEHLGRAVNEQQQTVTNMGSAVMLQSSSEIAQLLDPVKATMQLISRRLEAQEKERQQMTALQEVGALINSSLDQTQVLNTVMDTIIGLTGAERGFLMLIGERTGELVVEVARNINRESIGESSFEISRSIVETVAKTGQPVVTTNAQADPRFSSQESIISYNLRSILCVPLKIKETTIGVIYADNRIVSGIFTDSDRNLLSTFANQAAVAIENARLFQQIKNQLAHITEMTNLMNDVFDSIASGVITIDDEDYISLYNRAAERILGVPGHHALEKPYHDTLTPVSNLLTGMVERVKLEGGLHNLEVDANLPRRADAATLTFNFSPLRDIQQKTFGVAVVVEDISEKKRLESVRRYLPPALVDRVRDVDAAQRPQRQQLSIMFADVRGFSGFSEYLDPEQLIQVINQYFTVAARAITEHEGMIDKFMGDAVMALFNTPLNPQENHAERAARTALLIQQQVAEFHNGLPETQRLHLGIGVHMGEAVVGNVGSQSRKDYSALGDAVNLAKRLQEISKPGQILLSAAVYQQVQSWADVEELPPVQVKGRQTLEQIYLLRGERLKEP